MDRLSNKKSLSLMRNGILIKVTSVKIYLPKGGKFPSPFSNEIGLSEPRAIKNGFIEMQGGRGIC
jgi:hypothetical protein